MRSRIIWLARKVSTRRGAIGTSTPVFGLRPIRSPLSQMLEAGPRPMLVIAAATLCAFLLSLGAAVFLIG